MRKLLLPALLLTLLLTGCDHTPEPSPTPVPTDNARILQATWLEVDADHRFWVTLQETDEPSPISENPFGLECEYTGLRVNFCDTEAGLAPSDPIRSFLDGYSCQPYELAFAIGDWNFDGYTDLAFTNLSAGPRYHTNSFYLWDPETEQFIHDPDGLSKLNNPYLHSDEQVITAFSSAAGGSDWYDYYRYQDGALCPVRKCAYVFDFDTDRYTATVEDFTDGQPRTVFHSENANADWHTYNLFREDLSYFHCQGPETLWGFPIDDYHDAFEVPTGGALGTVLVTVEFEGEDSGESQFSVWNPNDLDAPVQTMTAYEMYLRHGSNIEDVNFDGYMDFTYSATWWAHGANARLWLWDEAAGQFVEEPVYAEIPNPRVDADTQTIEGYNYSGGWGLETHHRWENGELICFRQVEYTYPDEDFNQEKIIYERVNGELVEVSREPYAMLG